MVLRQVSATFTVRWSSNDEWIEAYLGVRRLVYDILPNTIAEQKLEDSALCQLALVGANHLVEVALGQVLRPFAERKIEGFTTTELETAAHFKMLTHWLTKMTGKDVDLKAQPFLSIETLRQRRNKTIHKTSALATVPIARSALFSAVEGCRAIYAHAGQKFPYETALVEDPIPEEEWFSDLDMPPAPPAI